jgi:hypothetical protein
LFTPRIVKRQRQQANMALAVYERFLAAPTVDALSPDASWHYITTTTSITGGEQVVKHLTSQHRIVKKKGDKTLSAIETPGALVLDVETTLEFLTGGGAYLPSLDDNFLADRVVTFPTVRLSLETTRILRALTD